MASHIARGPYHAQADRCALRRPPRCARKQRQDGRTVEGCNGRSGRQRRRQRRRAHLPEDPEYGIPYHGGCAPYYSGYAPYYSGCAPY